MRRRPQFRARCETATTLVSAADSIMSSAFFRERVHESQKHRQRTLFGMNMLQAVRSMLACHVAAARVRGHLKLPMHPFRQMRESCRRLWPLPFHTCLRLCQGRLGLVRLPDLRLLHCFATRFQPCFRCLCLYFCLLASFAFAGSSINKLRTSRVCLPSSARRMAESCHIFFALERVVIALTVSLCHR